MDNIYTNTFQCKTRVTRLGEILSIGGSFSFDQFLENYTIFKGYFFNVKAVFVLILTKMRWAKFWAIFSSNSSGHPVQDPPQYTKMGMLATGHHFLRPVLPRKDKKTVL
jgi:hypothetical protein